MKKLLLSFILCISAIPCFLLGSMEVDEVEDYLLSIDGLEIIERTQDRSLVNPYTYFYENYKDGAKHPNYEKLNNDPEVKAIIDSVDFEIETITRIKNLLYIFPYGKDDFVKVFLINTGELVMQKNIGDFRQVFYWEEAELFVYENKEEKNGEYKDYLHLYSADTLELQQIVSILEKSEVHFFIDFGYMIEYSDTQLIFVNRITGSKRLILYDVFSQEAQCILDLRPIFANSKDDLWNLRKINDTTIEFVISNVKSDSYFICQYDLTKMVLKDIDENSLP